jgi:hypothetical protein
MSYVEGLGSLSTLRARLSLLFRMSSMTRRSYGARPGIILLVSIGKYFMMRVAVEEETSLTQDYGSQSMIALTSDLPHNLTAECSTLAEMSLGLDAC